MNISPQASVRLSDGKDGQVTQLIYDPIGQAITHIVVRSGRLQAEHIVPTSAIENAAADLVTLNISEGELGEFERFRHTEFIGDLENLDVFADSAVIGAEYPFTLRWPYVPTIHPVAMEVKRVPPGEVAFGRGTSIEASDGPIGHAAAFTFDETGHLTHILLRAGHFWDRREVLIPLSAVEVVDETGVTLKLNRAEIERMNTADGRS